MKELIDYLNHMTTFHCSSIASGSAEVKAHIEQLRVWLRELETKVEPALYQIRCYNRDNTVNPGWQGWENVSRDKYDEICQYIEAGYLYYQVRTLTANHAMCHKLSPPDDCQGISQEGRAKDFVGNPFSFRK